MVILLQIVPRNFAIVAKGQATSSKIVQFAQHMAYQATVDNSSPSQITAGPSIAMLNQVTAPTINRNANSTVVTLEMVQQMIISAFSAMGLQGTGNSSSKSWLIDSAASNHMTSSSSLLKNVHPYHGSEHIQVANGNTLPIIAVGDITPIFNHAFVSSGLSTNLLFVRQLVENNCDVNFSRDGCCVQDQVSGTVIAKGPKVGRLFPVHISVLSTVALACSTVVN